MATTKIPVPKPGQGEPIVFFDIQLGGKFFSHGWLEAKNFARGRPYDQHLPFAIVALVLVLISVVDP